MTDKTSLSAKEAQKRLGVYGPNLLRQQKGKGPLRIFLSQFKDVLILILALACLFSVVVGDYTEAITIISIMLLNAFMGFIQEYRTEKTIQSLRDMTAPVARVLRDGRLQTIPAAEVVPGDTIELKAGDRVPADAEVIESIDLATDESILSGESAAVKKQPRSAKHSAVYMGTNVVEGHGAAVVRRTGMDTQMGAIAGMMGEAKEQPTPLQKRLAKLGTLVATTCLLICAAVVAVGMLRGEALLDMILVGLSLAVAAIPEGLPAVVTIVLALSVNRILERGTVIRKLHAVETLGSATVICSDKTGTITENKMTLSELFCGGRLMQSAGRARAAKGGVSYNGAGVSAAQNPALTMAFRCVALCSSASLERNGEQLTINGSPTEAALLAAAYQNGFDRSELLKSVRVIKEAPFDSAKKFMTVRVESRGSVIDMIKGAPDILLPNCTRCAYEDGVRLLDDGMRYSIEQAANEMAARALRVIAAVCKNSGEDGYTFLALFGLYDPPRPEVKTAVANCRSAGIRPVMITGDHKITAEAVAREAGILKAGDKVVEGAAIESMSEQQLRERCRDTAVFARVTPKHKLRIVRAYRSLGHVVAMTGDGVNDAPAIKEADIGVSMGIAGSDVTKEASSVVILDDNFATIVAAVEEGRVIYTNIRRFIAFMLASNLGEVLTVVLGMLFRMPIIFVPIQILLINLVTDGLPAVALGMERGGSDVMRRPPRPAREGLFAGGLLGNIVFRGMILGISNLLCFSAVFKLSGGALDVCRSATMLTLVLSQMLYVYECRNSGKPRGERAPLFSNKTLVFATLASVAVTLAIVYVPALNPIFHTAAIAPSLLPVVAGTALISPVIGLIGRMFDPNKG